MLDKFAVLAVAGIAGYYAYKEIKRDPNQYPYSKEQVATILTSAKTTLPRRDDDGQIQIWSEGRTAKGVMLNMKYAQAIWAPLLKCEVVVAETAPAKSHVVSNCGGDPNNPLAFARAQDVLRSSMFDEHIHATLEKRAFDRNAVDRQVQAAVFPNLPATQSQALLRAAETHSGYDFAEDK